MKHSFQYNAHNLLELFEGTTKFSGRGGWKSKLEKQSTKDIDNYSREDYVGDGFEFFVELMFNVMGPSRELGGIHQYQPNPMIDNGVDGICKNWEGEDSVVQIKYRRNTETTLTANDDHLSNLFSQGHVDFKIEPVVEGKNKCMKHFVITTAKGLNFYTDEQNFKGQVVCIGDKKLKSLLDNNVGFWREAETKVKELLNLKNQ